MELGKKVGGQTGTQAIFQFSSVVSGQKGRPGSHSLPSIPELLFLPLLPKTPRTAESLHLERRGQIVSPPQLWGLPTASVRPTQISDRAVGMWRVL